MWQGSPLKFYYPYWGDSITSEHTILGGGCAFMYLSAHCTISVSAGLHAGTSSEGAFKDITEAIERCILESNFWHAKAVYNV